MITHDIYKLHKEVNVYDYWIIGDDLQSCDKQVHWIYNNYSWYYILAMYFKPCKILELGVRFGYSLKSMILGSIASGTTKEKIYAYGIDNDCENLNCINIATNTLNKLEINFNLLNIDLKNIPSLNLQNFDMAHVDARHTPFETYQDLQLVKNCIKDGGIILIDDARYNNVLPGIKWFCLDNNLDYEFIESCQGIAIIKC